MERRYEPSAQARNPQFSAGYSISSDQRSAWAAVRPPPSFATAAAEPASIADASETLLTPVRLSQLSTVGRVTLATGVPQ